MFFGLCIYETLQDDGRLDSVIITPTKAARSLVVDRLSDVGSKLDSDVDLGPLRFYTRDEGLNVRSASSMMKAPMFAATSDSIRFHVNHSHLPLPESHAGYYILLLPKGYTGHLRTRPRTSTCLWLEDTQQIYLSLTATPGDNDIDVSGDLHAGTTAGPGMKTTSFRALFGSSLPNIYYSPVDNLIRALQHSFDDRTPSAFICHSSADKEKARRLAVNLATRGIRPWIDEAEIRVGDSLIDKIERGIDDSTCLLPLLSEDSVSSRWCKEELRMAMAQQIAGGGKRVLPIKLAKCDIPGFLLDKAYLDLSEWGGYDEKLDRLAADIRHLARAV